MRLAGDVLDQNGRRLLDQLAALVLIQTPDEGVLYANRPWCDLTGTSPEDNAGAGWLRCVHAEDRAAVTSAIGASRQMPPIEYRLLDSHGRAVAVVDHASSWHASTDQPLALVHTITPRAAAADDARARTMSSWAHELRGPLNAILGWSDLLSTSDASPDILQRGLAAIAKNARQQAAIIKRMTE